MTPERRKELARLRQVRYRARHPERVRQYKAGELGKAAAARYLAKHRVSIRARNEAIRLRYRAAVLAFLGGACKQCGHSDQRVLQIDHINGDGCVERRTAGSKNTTQFVHKLIQADPFQVKSKYQLLCANCNHIKRNENGEFGSRGVA